METPTPTTAATRSSSTAPRCTPAVFALETGQSLIGQPPGLSIDPAGSTHGATQLVAAASMGNPAVVNSGGRGVELPEGTTMRRVTVTGETAGVDASNVSSPVVGSNSVVQGQVGPALDIDGGSGAVTLGSDLSSSSALAARIRNRSGGSVTATGNVTGRGIVTSGLAGSTTTFSGYSDLDGSGSDPVLSLANPGAFSMTHPGNQIDAASGTALAVDGGAQAVTVDGAVKSASGTATEVKNRTGNSVSLSGKVDGAGIAMSSNSTSGTTVRLTGDVDISSGSNVALSSTGDGSLTISNSLTSLASTTGTTVDIGGVFGEPGGSGNISIAASIASTDASPVSVIGRSGGTVTFGGSIDAYSNSEGILVHDNAGSATTVFSGTSKRIYMGVNRPSFYPSNGGTVRISNGGLNIYNSWGQALKAVSGGTIEVSGPNNVLYAGGESDPTLEVSGGTTIADTSTVAADVGLRFATLDANERERGIRLDGTGSAGGLSVAAGTLKGYPYSYSPATGIDLTDAGGGVKLENLRVSGFRGDGIQATRVHGLSLVGSYIADSGNGGYAGSELRGLDFLDVTGTVAITNTTVSGSDDDNARIRNTTSTPADHTVTGSTFSGSKYGAGLVLAGSGASNVEATVTGGAFRANAGAGFSSEASDGPRPRLRHRHRGLHRHGQHARDARPRGR